MADAMQELESAIKLVHGATECLKEKFPDHELLQYAETFEQWVVPESFRQRFGGEHIPEHFRGTEFARAAMYDNYYEALRGVLNEE